MSNDKREHAVPTTVKPHTGERWFDDGHYECAAIFRVKGSSRAGGPGGWGFGGWGADAIGRVSHGADPVAGPHGYLFGRCSVIDNCGGTRAEHGRAAAEGRLFDVNPGDIIVAAGERFRVDLSPRGYPKLVHLKEAVSEKIDYVAALRAGLSAPAPAERISGCGRVYVCIRRPHTRGIRAACKRVGLRYLGAAYGTSGNAIYIGYDNATGKELARGTAIEKALRAAGVACYRDEVGD